MKEPHSARQLPARALLNWLLRNLGSLLLALVLALVVWVVASQEQNPVIDQEISQAIPIDVIGLDPQLAITNDYTETTRVRLLAQQRTWLTLSPEDVTVWADLSGLGPGVHQVPLLVSVDAPAQFEGARPAQVRVVLEEIVTREMAISLDVRGAPATGFTIEDAAITPEGVRISGPGSLVGQVSQVRATISLQDFRDDFVDTVELRAFDENGVPLPDVVLSPAAARVNIPIVQEPGVRDVAVQAPTIGSPPEGYFFTGVSVEPNVVTIRGNPNLIAAMGSTVNTQPIDLTGLTEDISLQAALDLPQGVQPAEASQGVVQVTVSITPQQGSRLVQGLPIQILQLQRGLAANIIPAQVDVLLSGPQVALNGLDTSRTIRVTLNLAGYNTGTYQVAPQVEVLAPDVKVSSVLPSTIEVRIQRVGP